MLHTPRILIINQSTSSAEATRKQFGDFIEDVDYVIKDADAIELCRYHDYDLIVTEQSLPSQRALELIRRIREICQSEHLPIISLPANSDQNNKKWQTANRFIRSMAGNSTLEETNQNISKRRH